VQLCEDLASVSMMTSLTPNTQHKSIDCYNLEDNIEDLPSDSSLFLDSSDIPVC